MDLRQRATLVYFLLLPFVFYTNFSFIAQSSYPHPSIKQPIPEKQETHFIEHQFKAAIDEIQLRIAQEDTLFSIRFTLVGAVLGALIFRRNKRTDIDDEFVTRNASLPLFLWVSVLVSSAVDIRMHFSVMVIRELGHWIQYVETQMFGATSFGWESWIANRIWDTYMSVWMFADRALVTWIFYFLAVFIVIVRNHRGTEATTYAIIRWSMPISWCSFAIFGSYYYVNNAHALLIYGFISLIVIGIGILLLPENPNTQNSAT